MAVQDDIEQVISNVGMQSLGIGSPAFSAHWTNNQNANAVSESTDAAKPITIVTADQWIAPMEGILSVRTNWEQIVLPSGNHITQNSVILRIYPQVHLRLKRLYATIIEGKTTSTHQPDRPVPYYFAYTNITNIGSGPTAGKVNARDPLNFSGDMTIHDEHGFPIDPVSVANIFDELLQVHQTLESKDLLTTVPTTQTSRQINHIGQLGNSETNVHLIDLFGHPFTNTPSNLNNITVKSQTNGLFHVTDTSIAIARVNVNDSKILFGSSIKGTLGNSFNFPTPTTVLNRDFLRMYVIKDFHSLLIGTIDAGDAAATEVRPIVRGNEAISFLLNGNATMGLANNILTNNTTKNVVVSPIIETDFTLPTDETNANAQWPNFPTGLATDNNAIVGTLENDFAPTAHFINDNTADVILVLNGLTQGQAVRVYNRIFLQDAREGRGDGAGNAVTDVTGKVAFRLKDPFSLIKVGQVLALPANPNLHVDIVVVNSVNGARVFGNVVCEVGVSAALSAEENTLLPAENNNLGGADFTGISHAGINGLSTNIVPLSGSATTIALALASEGTPRDAPRLPTMARLETIVAGSNSGTWNGLLSGCWLRKDGRNAQQKIGSPGSHGGKDFQTLTVQVGNGRIGYDLARLAMKHAKNIVERLVELADNAWNTPAVASDNTMVASVLHTIAPVCETPELSLATINNFPVSFSDFVDNIGIDNLFNGMPNAIKTQLTNALNSLKNNPNAARVYDEFKYEYSASHHGRRDAYWAAKSIINQARKLIYIEGSFFGKTDYSDTSKDLVALIKTQLSAHPNLKVIIALTKEPIYGQGYDNFKAREISKRKEIIDDLKNHVSGRVVAYHPIGFPGRPLNLITNALIIDDMWAMVGSTTFRRRGFTFDGGVDIVCFDKNIVDGFSEGIRALRKSLMSVHLNIPAVNPSATFPNPNLIRLNNMHQAFSTLNDLLEKGGAGLIEDIWDGSVKGVTPIDSANYPSDAIADPEGRDFSTVSAAMYTFLNNLGTTVIA